MKKLSLKERDELVTKGYLEDVLDSRFSAFEIRFEKKLDKKLEQKLEEKLEQKLEEKLEEKLEQKINQKLDQKFDEKFALWRDEMARHVQSLIEDSNHKFEVLIEGLADHQGRIFKIEEHIGFR